MMEMPEGEKAGGHVVGQDSMDMYIQVSSFSLVSVFVCPYAFHTLNMWGCVCVKLPYII